jgi:hypothetical protein
MKALKRQLGVYKAYHFVITTILTDREGAIAKGRTELEAMGILVNPTGAGQHAPVVENMICQVKERSRAHYNILGFPLSAWMFVYLVYFCVSSLNMAPSGTRVDAMSPREALKGRNWTSSAT